MDRLVDRLEAHCSTAAEELLLVAPFVKQPVLHRLLDATSPSTPVRIVTRWLPQEIAAGVSDIEVWDEVVARPATSLHLRHGLHAKLYRADGRCLVGSANLTGAAVGTSSAPNLELLVAVDADEPGLHEFERELFDGAVVVDADIVDVTRAAVKELPAFVVLDEPSETTPSSAEGAGGRLDRWLPRSRQPDDLFIAYTGRIEALSRVSTSTAKADLAVLRLPAGLDERAFRALVGAMLLRMPMVRALDAFVVEPRRFGEVRDFLAARRGDAGSSDAWQVLFRWLMHFASDRYEYRRPRHSEIIVRRGPR